MTNTRVWWIAAAVGMALCGVLTNLAVGADGPDEACKELRQSGSDGLPRGYYGQERPLSPDGIAKGRALFFDASLSGDGSVSCASCHAPEDGFAGREARSHGAFGRRPERFSPTIVNIAFNRHFLWDGRATSVEEQVRTALRNPNEMAADTSSWSADFEVEIVAALSSYVRSVISSYSRADEYLFGGNETALSVIEVRGLTLFRGQAHCAVCHTIQDARAHAFGGSFALFTDERFHNIGVGELLVKESPDPGRFAITGDTEHIGAFKTPTLRDVALRRRFMHNGSLQTLEEVVQFYNEGGRPTKHLDPLIRQLSLSEPDKAALVMFLRSLTGRCNSN